MGIVPFGAVLVYREIPTLACTPISQTADRKNLAILVAVQIEEGSLESADNGVTCCGWQKTRRAAKTVASASAVRNGSHLGSERVEGTTAHTGVNRHRAGVRLCSNWRLWGQLLTLYNSGCLPPVVMMQTADQWQLDYLPNVR